MTNIIKKESASLYALRGIAALLVLSVHISYFITPIIKPDVWLSHGVPIFYILTGYFSYLSIVRSKSFSIKKYLSHRASVLLPSYYLVLILTVVLTKPVFIATPHGVKIFITHLLGIQSFFKGYGGAIDGTLWMLSYSFLFYILIALFSSFIKAVNRGILFAVILIALSIIWRIYVFYGYPISERTFLGLGFFTPLGYIGFGIILAGIQYLQTNKPLFHFRLNKAFIPIIILFLISLLLFTQKKLQIEAYLQYWSRASSVILYPFLQPLYLAGIIYFIIQYRFHPTLEAISTYSGLKFIGKCSYSLYLIHLPVILSLKSFYENNKIDKNIWVTLFAIFMTTLILHYLVFVPAKNKSKLSANSYKA